MPDRSTMSEDNRRALDKMLAGHIEASGALARLPRPCPTGRRVGEPDGRPEGDRDPQGLPVIAARESGLFE
jgi:hypothetical protein